MVCVSVYTYVTVVCMCVYVWGMWWCLCARAGVCVRVYVSECVDVWSEHAHVCECAQCV